MASLIRAIASSSGQDVGELEEARLHDRVDPDAHFRVASDAVGVDDEELDLLVDDLLLRFDGDAVPDLVGAVGTVQQERSSLDGRGQHVKLFDENRLMAGNEVGLADEVGSLDGTGAESQVRDRNRTGLLRVIDEVALGVERCVLADDLHRVLVGTDCSVAAKPEEDRSGDVVALGGEGGIVVQAQVRHIVVDTDGEVVLRFRLGSFVENALDHGWCEFFGRQAVATADHAREITGPALGDSGDQVEVKGLAEGTGLFRPVQGDDGLHRLGKRGDEGLGIEGAVEADLDEADLFALGCQEIDALFNHSGTRAHGDDNTICVRGTDIIEKVVFATCQLAEFVHRFLDNSRSLVVERVACFPCLEEDVGVLGSAAEFRLVRVKGSIAMGLNQVHVDHRLGFIFTKLLDLVDFVRSAESIEEMDKGDSALQRGCIGDESHVLGFLNASGSQQAPARGSAGHHVAVVAENRQRMSCHRSSGDVEHR